MKNKIVNALIDYGIIHTNLVEKMIEDGGEYAGRIYHPLHGHLAILSVYFNANNELMAWTTSFGIPITRHNILVAKQ